MSQSLLFAQDSDGRVSEVDGCVAEFICISTQFGGDVSEVVGILGAFFFFFFWVFGSLAFLLGFSLVCNPAQCSRELYLQCPTRMYQLLSLLCKVSVSVSCAERITLMNRAVSPSHVRQMDLLVETSHARVLY